MTAVFADAGYWIELWRPRDALYDRAMTVAEDLGAVTVVTTQLVLIETLDAMAGAVSTYPPRCDESPVRQLRSGMNSESTQDR